MTQLLEQAIAKLRALPLDKQDQVAGFVLHELESDQQCRRGQRETPYIPRYIAALGGAIGLRSRGATASRSDGNRT